MKKSKKIPAWINRVSNEPKIAPETYITALENEKFYKFKYKKVISNVPVIIAHISADPHQIEQKLPYIIKSLKKQLHHPFTLKVSIRFHEIIVSFNKSNEETLFEFWNWSHGEKYLLFKNGFLDDWSITDDEQAVFPQI